MARRVGCRGESVVLVTTGNNVLIGGQCFTIDIPNHMLHLTDDELIARGKVVDGKLEDRMVPKPRKALRVAMIGAWGIPCGIATYAEALWPEVGALVGEWMVFAEENAGVADGPNVTASLWKRGQPMGKLADAVLAYKPDVVLIQHEYGLFPDARHWMSLMGRLSSLRTIVTMHSIYDHKDKGICEAAAPEMVVHSEVGKGVLRAKGIEHKTIHVIPHGCGPVVKNRLYNLYRTKHRFMQFGFGFRYKNWEASIGAVAILKEAYPDIFFTGLFSEGMFSKAEHDRYHAELMALAANVGVLEHIALIRGFQSEQTLDSYLGTNALAVFPYKNDPNHVVYGASGAARRAMQAGIPVIVSDVPHFADFKGVCPQAETDAQLAQAIDQLFKSEAACKDAVASQARFMADNSWANMAKAYVALI